MATTAELIEFLKQFPEGTQVEVLVESYGSYSMVTHWKKLDLSKYSDHWIHHEYADGRSILCLGDN